MTDHEHEITGKMLTNIILIFLVGVENKYHELVASSHTAAFTTHTMIRGTRDTILRRFRETDHELTNELADLLEEIWKDCEDVKVT